MCLVLSIMPPNLSGSLSRLLTVLVNGDLPALAFYQWSVIVNFL
jgi:hypothetical protein